jgi:hypothetical protein
MRSYSRCAAMKSFFLGMSRELKIGRNGMIGFKPGAAGDFQVAFLGK